MTIFFMSDLTRTLQGEKRLPDFDEYLGIKFSKQLQNWHGRSILTSLKN